MSQENIDTVIRYVTEYGLKVIVALLVFIVGKWVAGMVRKAVRRAMERAKVDETLIGFLSNIVFYLLMVAVVIAAVSQVGIQTTSFVAVLGAAGLAVGLALQGSLSNFASGVLLILFRPFKVGDFVEAGGVMGTVDGIGILMTHMRTPDNKGITVPNSQIMAGQITNFNAYDTRRVDLTFGIGYGDDIDKAKAILLDLVASDPRTLKDPAPMIAVNQLADSSVNIIVRPWVKSGDYWGLYWDMQEAAKKRFDAEGVTIPFPQRTVHWRQVA
jgi:small conductance mechanosensitive channel